jgi:tryptophan-rich sensory protein
VVFCEAVGFVGGLVTRPALPGWYAGLRKPSFNPPNWLFAPVWTALFAGMGVALYLVLTSPLSGLARGWTLGLFAVQLALNALWSILFFGLRSPGLAMVEILALWAAVLATTLAFFRVSTVAGGLFVPYLLWVSFAAALNFELWRLNRPG